MSLGVYGEWAWPLLARSFIQSFYSLALPSDVDDFDSQSELIVLEKFKNSLPVRVPTYVTEQRAQTALADEYLLTHKGTFFEPRMGGGFKDGVMGTGEQSWQSKPVQGESKGNRLHDSNHVCNFCHKRRHWKVDCNLVKTTPSAAFGAQAKGGLYVCDCLAGCHSCG